MRHDLILRRLAEILKSSGYHVLPPGEWWSSIPARDLDLSTNIHNILKAAYGSTSPGDLTDKSFLKGDLTIDDLARDFKNHRYQIADFRLMGPRWMRELEDALESTGALDRVENASRSSRS